MTERPNMPGVLGSEGDEGRTDSGGSERVVCSVHSRPHRPNANGSMCKNPLPAPRGCRYNGGGEHAEGLSCDCWSGRWWCPHGWDADGHLCPEKRWLTNNEEAPK